MTLEVRPAFWHIKDKSIAQTGEKDDNRKKETGGEKSEALFPKR